MRDKEFNSLSLIFVLRFGYKYCIVIYYIYDNGLIRYHILFHLLKGGMHMLSSDESTIKLIGIVNALLERTNTQDNEIKYLKSDIRRLERNEKRLSAEIKAKTEAKKSSYDETELRVRKSNTSNKKKF